MINDLLWKTFGRLKVISRAINTKDGDATWFCVCECGTSKIIIGKSLTSGRTKSCGCLLSQCSKERMIRLLSKHGECNTKLYRVWASMKERCYKPNCKAYKNYGMRGINVCDEWHDYSNFHKWAIESGYKEGLENDRRDTNGNYEPNNCRWVTSKVNSQNTRKCRQVIAYNPDGLYIGEFGSCNDAAKACGVGSSSIERVCKNIQPHIKGYKFKFKEDHTWN